MLTKNTIKHVLALRDKKYRTEVGLFVAEGDKIVAELLVSNLQIQTLFATRLWIDKNVNVAGLPNVVEVSYNDIEKISTLATPQQAIAIVKIPEYTIDINRIVGNLSLLLDTVQDPGNIGTIVRIADWFGITDVFCNVGCADIYNPKTVQSAMGSLARVRVHYIGDVVGLIKQLKTADSHFQVYATTLSGKSIYANSLSNNGLLMMGNESNGLSENLVALADQCIKIPAYATNSTGAESLNVAIATGIVCAEFRRPK